jgi:long-chain acyl-CoA synthetase
MERIWEEFYVDGVPVDIRVDEITLASALSRSAARYPDRAALVFEGTQVTFRELDKMVSTFAGALKELGVGPDVKVSFAMPNLIQTVVGIYGVLRAGGIVVMHNPRSHNRALEQQFNDAGSEVLICLDLLTPRMVGLRKSTGIKKIVSCHIRDYLPFIAQKLFPLVKSQLHQKTPEAEDVYEFTALMEKGGGAHKAERVDMNDTACILYTSGTTGGSKGVELSHRNLSVNVQQIRAWFPNFRDGKEILVGCLPFFHVFGLTCALNVGIFYGFTDALVPLPEPKNILKAIDSSKATFVAALPAVYNAVANDHSLRKYSLKSVEACFSGASPLPMETIRAFEKLSAAQICEGYGLTESSPTTHINPLGGIRKPGTIGLPLPSTDAKIVDPDDYAIEITEPDVPGELCVKGPQVMKGYVNLPDETAAAIRDGWLLTGDIVTVDSQGYFSVFDRKKDIISSPAERIYPRAVEEVLFSHPKVLDAGVIGIPDRAGGESIAAFVVLKKDESATANDIIDYCKKNLEEHQVPVKVEFLDELPRSAVGKTLRKELRRIHLIRRSKLSRD